MESTSNPSLKGESRPLPPSMRGTITVSVDVEDWHQLVTRRFTGQLPVCSEGVERQTERVLDILARNGVRGTFFVLGLVAKARPDLVKRIAGAGHEIASHGMSHIALHALDRDEVRRELVESRKLLSDVTGAAVVGFRAPEFSVTEANPWVLDEVAAAGYRYDSSIYPIAHRRYGIRSFARTPVSLDLPSGKLWELPLGTLGTAWGNLPVGGGGYFRLLPGVVLEKAMRSLTRRDEHVMLYFHPYEFTSAPLRLERSAMPPSQSARLRAEVWLGLQAMGRSRLPRRAERAVNVAPAVRAIDLVDALDECMSVDRHAKPQRNSHHAGN